MLPTNLHRLFIPPLRAHGIKHLITGSVASMLYGEVRYTGDIDILLHIKPADAPTLEAAFPPRDFYIPPADVIVVEAARQYRGHFNIIHLESGLKADIYLAGTDPLHRWAFAHGREIEYHDLTLSVAPPEYVIVRKLEFYREGGAEKHLRDIRLMFDLSGDAIDRGILAQFVEERGLTQQWQKVETK